jgi:hypothetical protein
VTEHRGCELSVSSWETLGKAVHSDSPLILLSLRLKLFLFQVWVGCPLGESSPLLLGKIRKSFLHLLLLRFLQLKILCRSRGPILG